MPLVKSIASRFGVNADHWRVVRREFDDQAQTAQIVLFGYASKAAANAGNDRLEHRKIDLPYADVKGMSARQMEAYVLANVPEFSGATDEA